MLGKFKEGSVAGAERWRSMVPGWGRAQTALGAVVTTLALTSVMGGHWRVLRRAETGSDLGFKWIVLAAAVLKEG